MFAETFSPQVLSELFPQRCVTGSVEAAALDASESAAALGACESAAALGESESAAALGARASPATALPSGSLSGLHLPTFSTNLMSNAAIQDVWVDTFIPGGQRVAICMCSRTGCHLATFTRRPRSSLYTLTTASAQVAEASQVAASSRILSSGTTASVTPPYRVSAVCTPVSLCLAFSGPCPPPRARLPRRAFLASQVDPPPLVEPLEPDAVDSRAETVGAEPWGAESGGEGSGGPRAGQPPQPDLLDMLSPQAIRAWIVQRGSLGGGGYGPTGARATSPRGTAGAGGTGGTAGTGGAASAVGTRGASGAGGAGGAAGARGTGAGGTGGAGAAGPGGAPTGGAGAVGVGGAIHAGGATGAAGTGGIGSTAGARGAGAAGAGGTAGAGGAGGATGSPGTGGAGGTAGAGGAGAGGTKGTGDAGAAGPRGACTRGTGAARVGGAAGTGGATGATGRGATGASGAACAVGAGGAAGAGGAGAAGGGGAGAAGTALRRPFFYPQPQTSLPPPDSLLPGSPLPAPHTKVTESMTERREIEIRASTPVHDRRVARPHPPAAPSTHGMALRPSSVPQRVVLPEPPASSLPHVPDPESDLARAASPTVTCLLATVVTDPDLESTAAFALVTELVDFAARSRLDYVVSLVIESKSVCPPSVRDPYALDIPTSRSYAEAIAGEYSSQGQTAMDVEMASWKSTCTYVLQRFAFQFSSLQPTPLSTGHSISAPPSDESVEPTGPYPELVGCLITSDMGLVLGGQGSVVLTGHSGASWAEDQATHRSCEVEIYAGAMAAQELRWLTYLLTDLGERPRSPPILYRRQLRLSYVASRANTAHVFTKALWSGDHHRFCTALGLVPTLSHLLVA
ncbi:unnamed protein product [Closterium sp. NIES-53]